MTSLTQQAFSPAVFRFAHRLLPERHGENSRTGQPDRSAFFRFDFFFEHFDEFIRRNLSQITFLAGTHGKKTGFQFLFTDGDDIRSSLVSRLSDLIADLFVSHVGFRSEPCRRALICQFLRKRSEFFRNRQSLICTGASQRGYFPAKCSVRIPINLSMEPKITLWIMTGLCFSPSAPT